MKRCEDEAKLIVRDCMEASYIKAFKKRRKDYILDECEIFHLSCEYTIIDDWFVISWYDGDVLTFGRSECKIKGKKCAGGVFDPTNKVAPSCECFLHEKVVRQTRKYYDVLCEAYKLIHLLYNPDKIEVTRRALLLFMWNMKPLLGRDLCTKIGQMMWAVRFEINLK